ncbi:MAG: flagellar assembly protein FliX [Alphaproteobacteria bacterium]|nr:flagellar assembly protein FliX [Alphaproteobacteria bacterium]
MKIEGPGGAKGVSGAKGKGRTEGSGSGFGAFMTSETASSAPAVATQSIAQLDALLALQGAEDPAARAAKGRMRERAESILEGLEGIRMAMLGGRLTVGHMVDIADVVASRREKISDPELTALMDEVDLRAQVELAKMRVALDRP